MPDNKSIRHPLDGKLIDVNDPNEVRYWCEIFKIDKINLIYLVGKLGNSAKKIKEHIDR